MITQLIFLLVFGICLSGLVKNKVLRIIISILIGALIGLELSSILLGNSLIDFKYYTHINLEVATQVGGFFFAQNIYSILCFIASGLSIYYISTKIRAVIHNKWIWISGILIITILLSIPKGVFNNLFQIGKIHLASVQKFESALQSLGYDDYTPKDEVKADPGKNIIAIFMESVEVGYLQDNLAHLTPNLSIMKDSMTFYPMDQNEGGDYTIGAIYTYLTGLPMYFKNHGNQVFDRTINMTLSSVPNALNAAGYNQLYLAGRPDFAGADNMMELMGIKVKSEKDYDPKYEIDHWGLHDKDLFEIANKELDGFLQSDNPFALYISTISTHAIDGVYDTRMANELSPQKTQLELMVAALDKHIGELVDRLKKEGELDNTAIYILPDHLLMGSTSRVLQDFEDPRGLFLVTNVSSPSYINRQNINQIDLPKIILEGADIKHNMHFLTDHISGDKSKYLSKNRLKILQLNEAGRLDFTPKKQAKPKADELVLDASKIKLISNAWKKDNDGTPSVIAVGKRKIEAKRGLNLLIQKKSNYEVEHFDTWLSKSNCATLTNRLENLIKGKHEFWLIAHDSAGDSLSYFQDQLSSIGFGPLAKLKGRRAYLAYSNNGIVSQKSRSKSVKENFPISLDLDRSQAEIDADANDPSKFIAHAGGIIDGHIYTNCLEALDLSYQKGFRYFELDIIQTKDNKYVAAHDWNQWSERNKYAGPTPVDLTTFMNTKVLGQYTPLDMAAINQWFAKHKDAYLVTDKVNNPKEFIPLFIDPNRLIMELFSFEAIEEAQSFNIKDILLSESIWDQLGSDKISGLKALNISSMAISIRTINAQRVYFQKLKNAGIKVYAFHIGNDGLKDEAYMVRSGLHFCEGLYADDWSFKN